MKHIIEGVKFYSEPEGKPGQQYMFCMGHTMNILAFHCSLFEDLRTFELLKAGWSFWYSPKTGNFRHAYARSRFFFNLKTLFGVEIEALSCADPSQFRDLSHYHICSDRPLLLWICLTPRKDDSDDGSDHMVFVGFGVDFNHDAVLLMNNRDHKLIWAPIEDIGYKFAHHRVHDFHVPGNCRMPEEDVVADLLRNKIESNFQSSGKLPYLKRYAERLFETTHRISYREQPPAGTLCGPAGIHAMADGLALWYEDDTEWVRKRAHYACCEIMKLRYERTTFVSLVSALSTVNKRMVQDISAFWERMTESWKKGARLFSKVYMSDKKNSIVEIQEHLHFVAEEEKQILWMLRDVLG